MTREVDEHPPNDSLIQLIVDSGASSHLIHRYDLFRNWRPYDVPQPVHTSTGQVLQATGIGDVHIYPLTPENAQGILIKGAIYVPGLRHNILSITTMVDRGWIVKMSRGKMNIQDNSGGIIQGERSNGLYRITADTEPPRENVSSDDGLYRIAASIEPLKENVSTKLLQRNTLILTDESECGQLTSEPQDLDDVEALPTAQRRIWYRAMKKEVDNLEEFAIRKEVTLPPGDLPISSRWTFKLKRDENNQPVRARARLVARGFQQQYGSQYDEVYAPVIKPTTFRIMISLAAQMNWNIRHVDVDSAFLYGRLKEKIYMTPPAGPRELFGDHSVYELHAAIYGLKQAAHEWYKRITRSLSLLQFKPIQSDPCLFVRTHLQENHYIIIHVDDLLVLSPSKEIISKIIKDLKTEYHLKDLGNLRCYLGQHLEYCPREQMYKLHQRDKILALINALKLEHIMPYQIPMLPDYLKMKISDQSPLFSNVVLYQSTLGSLMYLANISRPDIALATNILGRCAHQPTELDWQQLTRVVLYLKGTINYSLLLGTDPSKNLVTFSDADWGGDPHTRRSTSGGCHFIGGSLVSWKTQRQKCITLSTAEAEYVSAVETSRETVWLLHLFEEIQCPLNTPTIQNCDNQSTLALLSSLKNGNRSKHIDLKLHYLKELVDLGKIHLMYCPTKDMVADIFTKPLPSPRHRGMSTLLRLTGD